MDLSIYLKPMTLQERAVCQGNVLYVFSKIFICLSFHSFAFIYLYFFFFFFFFLFQQTAYYTSH